MNKKIYKLILTFIFVVFFKCSQAYAAKYEMKCDYGDSKTTIKLGLKEGEKTPEFLDGSDESAAGGWDNWDPNTSYSKDVGFSGATYYQTHNYSCPPYLIIDHDLFGNDIYFADEDHLSKVEDYIYNETTYSLKKDNYAKGKPQESNSNSNKSSNSNKPTSNASKSNNEKSYESPEVIVNNRLENKTETFSCGEGFMTGIPNRIPKFTKFLYTFLQILVPLILIILGSIDLIKSITSSKEDEIKKGQQIFIKRIITGSIVFFTFAFIKLLVGIVFPKSSKVTKCLNCFIYGNQYCVSEGSDPKYEYTESNNTSDVSKTNAPKSNQGIAN